MFYGLGFLGLLRVVVLFFLGNYGCDDDGVKGVSGDRALGFVLSLGCDYSFMFGGIVVRYFVGKVWN